MEIMKTEKEISIQVTDIDWKKIEESSKEAFAHKIALANEALKGKNLPKLNTKARAARKQQD